MKKQKIREEDHSISQPQPLEVVTDGDLEEIKKDPHEKENYMDAGGNPQKKGTKEIKDEEWFKDYAENVDFDKVKISDFWKRKKKAYVWKMWLAKKSIKATGETPIKTGGFFNSMRKRIRGDKQVEHPEDPKNTAGPTGNLPEKTDEYKPGYFKRGVTAGRTGSGSATTTRTAGDTGTGKMPSDPGKPAKPKITPRTALRPKILPKKESDTDTAFSIESESDRIEHPLGKSVWKSWLNKKKPKPEKIHDSTNWINIPNKEGKIEDDIDEQYTSDGHMINTDEIEAILDRKVRKPQDEHLIDPKWKSWLTIRKYDEDFVGGQSYPDDGSMPFYDHEKDPLYNYWTGDAEKKRNKKRREALDTEKKKRKKKSFFERMVAKKDKKWHCDLCNIELPNDDVAEQRKQRHSEFHTNEAVGTSKRPRNWTFGTARYTKKDGPYPKDQGDVIPDIKDTMPKPKPRETPRDSPFERAQPKKEPTKTTPKKAPRWDYWEWKQQNPGTVRAIEQRIGHEKRPYHDDEPLDLKRAPRVSGPTTGRERLDRTEEAQRKVKLHYAKLRRDSRAGWKKQENERMFNENEEYEAHVSDSNKAGYVERVGEAVKSNQFFFGGKRDRKTGKKAKLKPRKITLDEFTEKQNIIYHNKILPLISAIGSIGRVAMGAMSGDQKEMGEGGKDIGQASEQAEDKKKQ